MGIQFLEAKAEDVGTMKAFLVVLMAFMAFTSVMAKALEPAAAESETPAEDLEWLQWMNENRLEKRGGPSDPRSLFNSVYENYSLGKRFAPSDPRSLFTAVYSNYPKGGYKRSEDSLYPSRALRGLRSPQDPRNLFRAVYGWK